MINLKESRRIKTELLEKPQDYLTLIENTDLAICITNEDGKFVAVNENYCQLYGYNKQELIGQKFTIVVPEQYRANMAAYHGRFFTDKYEIIRKWKVINKNGETLEIYADAGFNDQIEQKPHKITLIQLIGKVESIDETDQLTQKS